MQRARQLAPASSGDGGVIHQPTCNLTSIAVPIFHSSKTLLCGTLCEPSSVARRRTIRVSKRSKWCVGELSISVAHRILLRWFRQGLWLVMVPPENCAGGTGTGSMLAFFSAIQLPTRATSRVWNGGCKFGLCRVLPASEGNRERNMFQKRRNSRQL